MKSECSEQLISGTIELFSVDVTIGSISEADEEEIGAKVLCTLCNHSDGECSTELLKVSVGCSSYDGELSLQFPAGELLVSEGTKKVAAKASYPAAGIAMRNFWLHPLAESIEKCDHAIVLRHSLSDACDKACYTSYKVDFVVEQENVPSPIVSGCLVDNHPATLRITYKTPLDGIEDFKFYPYTKPAESGSLVNHDNNFTTSFIEKDANKTWSIPKVLWYGVLQDKEYYTNAFAHKFILRSANPRGQIEHEYKVSFPDENPAMNAMLSDKSTSYSTAPVYDNNLTGYKCEIVVGDFIKGGSFNNLPTSDQYFIETEQEEKYHEKQWLGLVSWEDGSSAESFTKKGIQYFAIEKYGFHPGTSNIVFFASSKELALYEALSAIKCAEDKEFEYSRQLEELNFWYREVKAKEKAGYNAAWRYHCCYEDEHPLPVPHKHHIAYE